MPPPHRSVPLPHGMTTGPTAWVERHEAATWRWLRGLGASADVAQDLLQDAFLAALDRPDWAQWDEARSRAWLRAATRNLWRMHLRTDARRRRRERLAAAPYVSEAPEPDSSYLDALRRCQDQLPARSQRALTLRYGEGKSRDEMARALDMRPEGIKSLLQRLRAALRRCIEQHANT